MPHRPSHTKRRQADKPAPRRPRLPPGPAAYLDRGALTPPRPHELRLVTWNINSVRLRLGLLGRLIRLARPDIVCLQETKVADDLFPREQIAKLGLPHQVIHGMKGYNGVAILSRRPLVARTRRTWCDKDDSRHAEALIGGEAQGDIELHNIYVPAGGDIPDPKLNPKFAHKLRFLDEQRAWWERQLPAKRILVGDFNVAPYENDVWSHKQMLDVVSHTPAEVSLLSRLLGAQAWLDVARKFVPESKKLYSWWSYRNQDWRVADRGRRLDHVWVSPALADAVSSYRVLRAARDWPNPSDHVPVIVDLDLSVGGR